MASTGLWSALTRDRGPGARGPATRQWDPPAWLAWACVLSATAVTLLVVWHSTAPLFVNDEVSVVGASRLLVHPGQDWQLGGLSYLPGTAALLAPVWWFTDDPATFYRIAVLLLGLVSVAIVWPLTRIAQELGMTRNTGMVLGSIIAAAPDHALLANYVWSEQLLSLMVAIAVWRGMVLARQWGEGTLGVAAPALFALAIAGCYLVHGRAVLFAGVGGVALVVVAWRSPRRGLPAVGVYGAVMVGAHLLYRWVSSSLYPDDARTGRTLRGLVDQTPAEFASTAVSQAWYHSVTWLGLGGLGALLMLSWSRRGQRLLVARWLLCGVLVSAVFISMMLAGSPTARERLDLHVYGRYLAPFVLPLAFVGLAGLARGISGRIRWAGVGLVSAATALMLVLVVPGLPPGGIWSTAHLPGVAFMLSPRLQYRGVLDPWMPITLVLGIAAIFAIVLSRWRKAAVAVIAGGLVGITLWTDQRMLLDLEMFGRKEIPHTEVVRDLPTEVVLAGDSRAFDVFAFRGFYTFWSHPRSFILYDPDREARPSDLVVARMDWETAHDEGALPVKGSFFEAVVVWVFPGELQDRLRAADRLHEDPYEALPGFEGFSEPADRADSAVNPPG